MPGIDLLIGRRFPKLSFYRTWVKSYVKFLVCTLCLRLGRWAHVIWEILLVLRSVDEFEKHCLVQSRHLLVFAVDLIKENLGLILTEASPEVLDLMLVD